MKEVWYHRRHRCVGKMIRLLHIHIVSVIAAAIFVMVVQAFNPQPIDPSGWPDKFPAKEHCSKCGLCETTFVSHVTDACAFLGNGMARIDNLEAAVHGRKRNAKDLVWSDSSGNNNGVRNDVSDEGRFGVMTRPIQLAKGGVDGAQWTGVVTSIALSMLESGMVDAVVCIANNSDNDDDDSWSDPKPILARTVEDVLKGRGVKPALAPSLAVLDVLYKHSELLSTNYN